MKRYYALADIYDARRSNEQILAYFFELQPETQVDWGMLQKKKFNWAVADAEMADNNERIWKRVGEYRYLLQADKTVTICKNNYNP